MKTSKIVKESTLWIIVLIPLAYLGFVWNELPEQVPLHFNIRGEADGWGSRQELLWLILLTTAGLNLLLLLIPAIDPKRKLQNMGSKYTQLRFVLVTFMSALGLFIIANAAQSDGLQFNGLMILLGTFFALMGNYFQALKPNYFIGIRTPWTLESESVWRKTHRLGGRLWIVGGLGLVLLSFLPDTQVRQALFLALVGILALVPILYSFIVSKKQEQLERHS
ncbi:MAG: SdpI family protein [Bacteroidetes bacterium]|nr:SdpI family protein [Bacteroidota bacterium]